MRIAIFADLHDNLHGLRAVTADAQRQNADRLIYLGDTGHQPALYAALRAREVTCILGNWEVSGVRRLPPDYAAWVSSWPVYVDEGPVRYTHATPDIPASVTDTASADAYVAQHGWRKLYPNLEQHEEPRWHALAALESADRVAAFHGHTHIQQHWRYDAQRWRMAYGPADFALSPGARHLIGVGSAGKPNDGSALRYAIYDDVTQVVSLCALSSR